MAAVQKNLSSWHKLILNGDIETALEQLKLEITSGKWTLEEQNSMANFCLITTNMRAYELMKSTAKDPVAAHKIFLMTNFCCSIIEKTWKCQADKFLGSIRVICQYFLASDKIYEALVISQYSMEFEDHHNEHNVSKDEKIVTVKDMLLIYLQYLSKDKSCNNLETILDVWKFILSPQGLEAKRSNFTFIFKCLVHFCSKVNSTESSLLLLSYLSKMPFINFTDQNVDIFINTCEFVIRQCKNNELKNNIPNLIRCIEEMKPSYSKDQHLVLKFCCEVLRFSNCLCVFSTSSCLVDNCLKTLNSIWPVIPMLRNRAVNFARVVLIQAHSSWINEGKFFYRDCLANFFAFFTKFSETLRSIEMEQKDQISENKYFNISSLSLSIIPRVQDCSSEELLGIYSHVKNCLSISLGVYDDDSKIDNSQKTQLYSNMGGHCFNVCCIYSKAKLYNECGKFCSMIIQKITAVSNDLVMNSPLPSYIENLTTFLYQSNEYEAALKTACVWAAKFPPSRNIFMKRYGSFKARICYENQDYHKALLNKTCWDLIIEHQQKYPSLWETINFSNRDAMHLLKSELKQIFIHQMNLFDLVEKIISQSKKRDDSTKIEACILGGLILTRYSQFVNKAVNLLPLVDNCIEELGQKLQVQELTKEKIIKYTSFLGCLHYVKFRIRLLNARCKNEEEVAITKNIKSMPSEPGMEQETRDDSDVIHEHLTYKSQQEFISYLDSAIECWSRAINQATLTQNHERLEKYSKICEEMDIQTLIHDTALIFRLYCAESREIRAWKLLHSLASIREDNEKIIYAFSNLVSLNTQIDPEWETKVQQKLPDAEKTTQIRYRLEIIHKLFINGRGIEGVEMLSQVSEECMENDDLLAAKYNFLISRYSLANFYRVFDYPLKTALRAYQLLINCYKKNAWRNFWEACEIQSLLLDVGLFIIQFHLETFQTTLIKSFADTIVYLIKKLGLPLRICNLLTTLCTLGVVTCKCEDIYVKLNALKTVLKFNDSIAEENYDKKPPVKTPALVSSTDFHSNTDVRFVSNFDDNYTSPILESGLKYDMPEFVYHKSRCRCVICDDVHYQQICCEVMSLFGSYFWMQKSNHHGQALHHFEDALEMSNKLRSLWKDADRSNVDGFLKTWIVTKMRLGDFWASANEFEKAEKSNKEALNEYENLIVRDGALRAQLTDQYLALEYIKLSADIKQDLPKKRTVRQKLALGSTTKPSTSKSTVKVFEDDQETSRISKLMENMSITPLPRHSRRLLFKDDDEFTKPTASSRVTRIRNKKEDTPPDIVMQTPSALKSKSNSRKKLESRHATALRLEFSDDFNVPAQITSSSRAARKKPEENTDSEDVTQTPSSRTRSRKILHSKIPSVAIKIDGDLLAASGELSTFGSITKKRTKKDALPLDIVKEAPRSSRTRAKKTEENSSSSARLKIRKN